MILYSQRFATKTIRKDQLITEENILDGSEIKWFPAPCIGEANSGHIDSHDPASIEDVFSEEKVEENLSLYKTLDIFSLIRLIFSGKNKQIERSKFAGAEEGSTVANFLNAYVKYPQYTMFDQKWLKQSILEIIKTNEREMITSASEALDCDEEEAFGILSYKMTEGIPPKGYKDASAIINSLIAAKVADLYEDLVNFRIDLVSIQIFHSAIFSQLAVDTSGSDRQIMRNMGDKIILDGDRTLLLTRDIVESVFWYGIKKSLDSSEESGSIFLVGNLPEMFGNYGVWLHTRSSDPKVTYKRKVTAKRHIPILKHRQEEEERTSKYDDDPEKVFDEISEIV